MFFSQTPLSKLQNQQNNLVLILKHLSNDMDRVSQQSLGTRKKNCRTP